MEIGALFVADAEPFELAQPRQDSLGHPADLAQAGSVATRNQARDAASYGVMLRESVGRVAAFPSGHLALLELRLEATRRPELRTLLTERVRADIDENVTRHEAAGLAGGATAVRLM